MHGQENSKNGADSSEESLQERSSRDDEDEAAGDENRNRAQRSNRKVFAQRRESNSGALIKTKFNFNIFSNDDTGHSVESNLIKIIG